MNNLKNILEDTPSLYRINLIETVPELFYIINFYFCIVI